MSNEFIQEESISGTVNATDVYVGDDVVKSVNGNKPDKNGAVEVPVPTKVSQLENDSDYITALPPFVLTYDSDSRTISESIWDASDAHAKGRPILLNLEGAMLPMYAAYISDDFFAMAFLMIANATHQILIWDGETTLCVNFPYVTLDDIPTVPDNVSAFENDANYITMDDVQDYVDSAIFMAKDSGQFDGKDGEDGYTPVKGEDYFTDDDKIEMVNAVIEAIENLDEVNF